MNQSELLSFYRKELRRSKNWRRNASADYDDSWRRYIDLYHGRHYDKKSGTDQLTVNLIFSTINVIAPATAINNPRFVVNARKPESEVQAVLTEEVLNYLWRAHKFQSEVRLGVLDWLLIGHGWVKVGYKAVKPPEMKKAGLDDEMGVADLTEQAAVDEGVDDREPIPGNVESEMTTQSDDRPFLERISPFDMFVDPDARHPKEMRWIAQRVWRPVADVRVDSRYSPTNRQKVSSKSWSRWETQDGDGRAGGSGSLINDKPDRGSIGYVEIIEFYDIKRNRVSTFAFDGDESDEDPKGGFLIKPEQMPYAMGHPFVMLRNYEVPDHFYPIGDVAQIESLQLELNETRNQMLNFRKKYRRAYLYQKDAFDREGIAALQSEDDNVMIPVADPSADLAKAVRAMPIEITPPEFFNQSGMITNDMDRVSGVSDYQRGATSEIRRTATEAAMIQDSANARAQDRIAKIENILSEIGERVVGLMQQFLTGDHVARIVTIPVNGWVQYSAEWIQGQFDFEVQGGSTEPQNETFRRQSALQLVDVMAPFAQAGVVNMPAMWMELLSKGFGKKDAQRFVNMPPPPPELGGPGGPPGGPPMGQPALPPGQPAPMPQGPPPAPGGGGPMLSPEDLAMMMAMAGGGAPMGGMG